VTPRRLVPILAVFVVLAALYFALDWHQARKTRQEEEAKKLFAVKEAEINAITLKRPTGEIRLVKEGKDWRLAQPLKDQADAVALTSLVNTLAGLRFLRDLGPEKDVKPFGLDQPALILSFTAGETSHTLSLGAKAPGGQGWYARRDQDPRVLLIDAAAKETLDRPLADLRNRALFDFLVENVKALRVKTRAGVVVLEKKDGAWQWQGRENVKVQADRLGSLLRFVSMARVKEFVADAPKDLKTYGLEPPALDITVVTDKGEQRLMLGARLKDRCFARRGDQAPVVLMENLLLDLFTTPLEKLAAVKENPQWNQVRGAFPFYLEDRRLWTGEAKDVASLTWGAPEKTWTGARDKDFFNLRGPGEQEVRQPALRVELALLKLRDLEFERLAAAAGPEARGKNFVELRDAKGQTLFRLEEIGPADKQVRVRFAAQGAAPREALVSRQAYGQWRQELEQLTGPPPKK
jgi:hypothetical protein